MPRFAIFLLSALFFSGYAISATAQSQPDHVHEISISVGQWSSVELLQGEHGGEDGYSETPIEKYSGAFACSYRYYFTPRVAVGVSFSYENEQGGWNIYNGWSSTPEVSAAGTFKRNVFTLAPEILFNYTSPEINYIKIYGYFGIGYTFQNEMDTYSMAYYITKYQNGVNSLGNNLELLKNRYNLNAQFCPIAISIGRKLSVFTEFGFGYKGVFNAGASIKL